MSANFRQTDRETEREKERDILRRVALSDLTDVRRQTMRNEVWGGTCGNTGG